MAYLAVLQCVVSLVIYYGAMTSSSVRRKGRGCSGSPNKNIGLLHCWSVSWFIGSSWFRSA